MDAEVRGEVLVRGFWLLALMALLSSCDRFEEAGPLTTVEARAELGGARSARLSIDLPGGLLEVSGGGQALVEASFRFDNERLRPVLRRTMEGDRALVEISAPGYEAGLGRTRNEWALALSAAPPLDLELAMRAGRAELRLSGLPIRSLDLNLGAGELIVDLSGPPPSGAPGELTGQLEMGHGKLLLRLPGDAGLRVRAWKSVGTLEVAGLEQVPDDPGAWVNPGFAAAPRKIDLTARLGWGDLEIVVVD